MLRGERFFRGCKPAASTSTAVNRDWGSGAYHGIDGARAAAPRAGDREQPYVMGVASKGRLGLLREDEGALLFGGVCPGMGGHEECEGVPMLLIPDAEDGVT